MDTISELLGKMGLSKRRLDEIRAAAHTTGSNERLVPTGHLKILGIDNDRTWTICDDKNMVTNTGYTLLASMWGGPVSPETYNTLKPNRIAIGTGYNASPTPSMTTLQMTLPVTYISQLTNVTFTGSPNINGCRFELLIPNGTVSDTYNGVTLREAGLFPENYSGSSTGAGGMIAYKTYPSITKTDQFSLLYLWSFTFTPAV